jgi:hypothetical protein
MNEGTRERVLILIVVGALIGGLLLDFSVQGVDAPEPEAIAGARLFERASFCGRPMAETTMSQVTVGTVSPEKIQLAIEPESGDRLVSLQGPAARTVPTTDAAQAVGYRALVSAAITAQMPAVQGSGAARCSSFASTKWYFPEGSSALGFDERLILYNPFPDEAVARVTLYTPGGEITKARLTEGIPVPAGETRVVKVNDFVPPEKVLGAVVEMGRGRAVAWRASLIDAKEQPTGLQFTLGANATAESWYLPAGSIEEGIDERVSLLNPSNQEAIVSLSLVTSEETLQPPRLVDIRLPARTTTRLLLAELVGKRQQNLGGVGVVVTSTNSVGIVAERTLWYDISAVTGTSSEVGGQVTRELWLVPPALLKPVTDTIVVLNPGLDRARVSLALLGPRGPKRPSRLQDVVVGPSRRRRIELGGAVAGMVMLESNQPVAVERSATSARDAAAVLGIPSG